MRASELRKKNKARARAKLRIRKTISGSSERPRVSIFKSNKNTYAQAIDDVSGKTIVSASSKDGEISESGSAKSKEVAEKVGELLGTRLVGLGIQNAVLDRNGYVYKGRLLSLTEGIRKSGVKI